MHDFDFKDKRRFSLTRVAVFVLFKRVTYFSLYLYQVIQISVQQHITTHTLNVLFGKAPLTC